MKYVACHSNYGVLNKNGNMLNNHGDISIKDFLRQMCDLKYQGSKKQIAFKTSDEISLYDVDAFLFIDMPKLDDVYYLSAVKTRKPMFLLAWESGIINPRNSDPNSHNNFRVVFTYDDELLSNEKYIKVCYSFLFPDSINRSFYGKKLCCLIAGNKISSHSLELYSQRLDAINWFEKNHLEDFDLYGQGWNKIIPAKNFAHRIINKFSFISDRLKPRHPSYKGAVEDKLNIYEKYLFAICYENARDLSGYISEKIFDCFFSGCVPVYWGAPNISQYIPENCYIDRKKFEDNAALYNFISQMTESEYFGYLNSIESFINNEKNGIFSVKHFSNSIISHIAASMH